MPLKLRDYQAACLKRHFTYFERKRGNPLMVIPTGGGKSLVIAEFCRTVVERWPSQRIIILTHQKELIEQNHDEFLGQWGLLAPVGIYSAGIGRRDTRDNVIFAGIQSVWSKVGSEPSKAALALGRFDLVLIDEAHLLPKSGEGRYRSYLAWLRKVNPSIKVIGYTATPFRLEGGLLHRGDGRVFTDIAYEVDLEKLIADEYLAPLVAKKPREGVIDTTGVGTVASEFKKGELQLAAMSGDTVAQAVNEMLRVARAENRKHWLVFACGVDHARDILSAVRSEGVSAEAIFGNTPKPERDDIVRRAKAGEITCLVNVSVLTTGFNWTRCDLLAVMRPTKSAALYVQIMGRGMRTHRGKTDCLVLDYGGNVERHGPINRITTEEKKKTNRKVVKVCPKCDTYVALAARRCPECDEQLVDEDPMGGFREPNHDGQASFASPIDFTVKHVPPDVVECQRASYSRHQKSGRPDSLRVTYHCGLRRFSEWVCLEHTGFAARKAQAWWGRRGKGPAPTTVSEALERISEIPTPSQILVRKDGEFDRVIDTVWKRAGEEEQPAAPLEEGADRHGTGTGGRPW